MGNPALYQCVQGAIYGITNRHGPGDVIKVEAGPAIFNEPKNEGKGGWCPYERG